MLSFNNEPVILDLRRESINEWRPKNVMKNVKITTPPNTFFIPRALCSGLENQRHLNLKKVRLCYYFDRTAAVLCYVLARISQKIA